jgi:hypothetical protein
MILRAFVVACLVIVVLGAGAYFGLNTIQKPSGIAYTTDSVRIDPQWSWRSTDAPGAGCGRRAAWQWIFIDFGKPAGEPTACSASQ